MVMRSNGFMRKILVLFLVANAFSSVLYAQEDDMMKLLDAETTEKPKKEFTTATFKGTRLINFQTLETLGKRTLDFRISHRFGDFNSGANNAFGLDGPACIRLGLEYSFEGRFMFGIGRTSYEKKLDGFLKYRLLRQTTNNSMPLSVTLVSSMFYTTVKGQPKYGYDVNRLS